MDVCVEKETRRVAWSRRTLSFSPLFTLTSLTSLIYHTASCFIWSLRRASKTAKGG